MKKLYRKTTRKTYVLQCERCGEEFETVLTEQAHRKLYNKVYCGDCTCFYASLVARGKLNEWNNIISFEEG